DTAQEQLHLSCQRGKRSPRQLERSCAHRRPACACRRALSAARCAEPAASRGPDLRGGGWPERFLHTRTSSSRYPATARYLTAAAALSGLAYADPPSAFNRDYDITEADYPVRAAKDVGKDTRARSHHRMHRDLSTRPATGSRFRTRRSAAMARYHRWF